MSTTSIAGALSSSLQKEFFFFFAPYAKIRIFQVRDVEDPLVYNLMRSRRRLFRCSANTLFGRDTIFGGTHCAERKFRPR